MGKRSFAINDCDGYIFYNRESFTTGKPYIIIESGMEDEDIMEEISKLVTIINGGDLSVDIPVIDNIEEPNYNNYDDAPFSLDDIVEEQNLFENMKDPELIKEETIINDTFETRLVVHSKKDKAIEEIVPIIKKENSTCKFTGVIVQYGDNLITLDREDVKQLVKLHEAMNDYGFELKKILFEKDTL